MNRKYMKALGLVFIILITSIFSGCSRSMDAGNEDTKSNFAPVSVLPNEIKNAPASVRESYQFAISNPQILEQLPCYCGCGGMGHTSNYSCYISGKNDDDKPLYDLHALGCSICVDITQDAIRMLDQGKSLDEIKDYVDMTYSRFGPSNLP